MKGNFEMFQFLSKANFGWENRSFPIFDLTKPHEEMYVVLEQAEKKDVRHYRSSIIKPSSYNIQRKRIVFLTTRET